MSDDKKLPLKGLMVPPTGSTQGPGVEFSGYLIGDETTEATPPARLRLYPALEDLSRYVEFDHADMIGCVPHPPTKRVTVLLRLGAHVQVIHAGEARFFKGALSSQYMSSAPAPSPPGSASGTGIHPLCVGGKSNE
jgi:hypothetical protein